MLKLSTETYSISKFVGDKEAIRLIKEAGFDYYDMSLFNMGLINWETHTLKQSNHPLEDKRWKRYILDIKKYADSLNIKCNQTHAPYPSDVKGMKVRIKRAIIASSILGAKQIIIHPYNNATDKANAKFYQDLLKFAKPYNIKICTENMWNWDNKNNRACFAACASDKSFADTIDLTNDKNLGACLDIGHAEMMGDMTSAVSMIKSLNNRLIAMHLHDNDKLHDSHSIPFSMKIDFEPIAKALTEINYQGDVTLEAAYYIESKEEVTSKVKELYYSAKKFAELIEKYR